MNSRRWILSKNRRVWLWDFVISPGTFQLKLPKFSHLLRLTVCATIFSKASSIRQQTLYEVLEKVPAFRLKHILRLCNQHNARFGRICTICCCHKLWYRAVQFDWVLQLEDLTLLPQSAMNSKEWMCLEYQLPEDSRNDHALTKYLLILPHNKMV